MGSIKGTHAKAIGLAQPIALGFDIDDSTRESLKVVIANPGLFFDSVSDLDSRCENRAVGQLNALHLYTSSYGESAVLSLQPRRRSHMHHSIGDDPVADEAGTAW